MKLVSPALHIEDSWGEDWLMDSNTTKWACLGPLRKRLTWPKEAKRLWLVLRSRPTSQSVPITIRCYQVLGEFFSYPVVRYGFGISASSPLCSAVRDRIARRFGKTGRSVTLNLHLSMEYE